MKLRLIKIGKPSYPEYQKLFSLFEQKISHHNPIEIITIKASHGLEKNTAQLNKQLYSDPRSKTICCDENGEAWSSPKLASQLDTWRNNPSVQSINLVIGGPYGLSDSTKEKADHLWCLSAGVLPSDLACLIVHEQLYRAFSILAGSSYHHE